MIINQPYDVSQGEKKMYVVKEFYVDDTGFIGASFCPTASRALEVFRFIKQNHPHEYAIIYFLEYDIYGILSQKAITVADLYTRIEEGI